MSKIIMLVGSPGSGKSTLAKSFPSFVSGSCTDGYIYINQDSQGKEHLDIFKLAIEEGLNVLIDRMSFNKEQRERYLGPAREAGYTSEIRVLHVPFNICMQRCLDRVGHETIKTKEDASRAINFFFSKYERVTDDEADVVIREYDVPEIPNKTSAIICDLDGTLCNIDHRLHYVRRDGKKDWKSFNKEIPNDDINLWCKTILEKFKDTHQIVLCSGRSDDNKRNTIDWLKKFNIEYHALYMRNRNDYRDDSLIKENILDFEILTRYKVLFTIDDRKRVTDMWRSRELICLQCHEGNF